VASVLQCEDLLIRVRLSELMNNVVGLEIGLSYPKSIKCTEKNNVTGGSLHAR